MLGKSALSEVYTAARPDYSGRVTVPVLWDKQTATIVSNESSEIVWMLNRAFDGIGGDADVDFCPPDLADEIEAVNTVLYDTVNNGDIRPVSPRSRSCTSWPYDRCSPV